MIVGSTMKVLIITMLFVIGFVYCQSPLEKAGDVVSPPDLDVVLDTMGRGMGMGRGTGYHRPMVCGP